MTNRPGDVPGVATLGPEPLADDFTTESLAAILRERRTQIKGVLRDQPIIAGIGNAYSDEVLHVARMSPYKLGPTSVTLAAGLYHLMIPPLVDCDWHFIVESTQQNAAGLAPVMMLKRDPTLGRLMPAGSGW